MTKDEIVEKMESLGIILLIGDKYFLTEKYKEVLENPIQVKGDFVPPKKLNYDKILDGSTNGSSWPVNILESKGRVRATAFCDYCNIPRFAPGGYTLRGMDKEAVNILGNIVDSEELHPPSVLQAVTTYYKYSEMPKGIKNLLKDGTLLEIYESYIDGSLIPALTGKSDTTGQGNSQWQN